MSKSSSTSAKTAVPLPHHSAWARGPPNTSVSSVVSSAASRSQSPAPSAPQHSRRSSQHAAIGIGMGNVPRSSKPGLSFGTVNDSENDKQSPLPPPSAQPLASAPSRTVPTFGSLDATASTPPVNGKPGSIAGTSSTGPSMVSKTSSATAAPSTTPSSVPAKPKMDISALFRGTGSSDSSSTVEPAPPPAINGTPVSSAVPLPHAPNAPGPNGPGPHAHPIPSHPQGFAFGSNGIRNQPSNTPRSPSFSRPGQNGAAGRPPGGPGGPPNSNMAMASPRLGPPNHPPPHHHAHQQPQQAIPGMPPQMAAWPGYYPYYPGVPPMPGAEYMYAPQPWMHMPSPSPHGGTPVNGPPPTPHGHSHGLPVSPRQPPPPLQTPGTPPASIAAPLASAGPRLNTNASAFVPGQGAQPQQRQQTSKVKITDASGHEVDFNSSRHKPTVAPPAPSTSLVDKSGRRGVVRIETEEARQKRIAEENAKKEAEAEAVRKKKEAEAEVERKRKEEEEKERQRVEEERLKKEEAERLEREEKERLQKEEEERKKREEEERIRKEEEEKARKEKEEQERKEEEERQRVEEERRKEEEKERLRKEEEKRLEEERVRKEAEKLQQEEERKKEEAAKVLQQERSAALEIRSRKEGISSPITDSPLSTSPESHKKRPVPGPLDLSVANKNISQPLPSALATARHIQDVYQIQYPEGIKSPKPELNTNAKDGKFRYDRDFLLQFMSICKEKPDNLPPLEAIGLEPSDQTHSMGRTSSGRRGMPGGMPSSNSRQASVGLGIVNGFGKSGSGFMGSFSTNKLSSEERFMRSTSLSGGPPGFGVQSGRNSPMVRSSSQGGPGGMGAGGMGNKRTRSKRGEARNETNRMNAAAIAAAAASAMLEPVAPLEVSANRWTVKRNAQGDQDTPEVVDRKVRALLNKLTMERFDSISDQIIVWANKSEKETDGRTLIQVIRLVFEKATDEATWSEMYARLCRKMMEQISPNVQDEGIRNAEGRPITGGLLFRKYLLNRCQEDFERGWAAKDSTAAAAKAKASEDQAVKEANEKGKEKGTEEVQLYSDEYYAAQKAKRQGLGLVTFIGELYKLQMLTERIMHECIKKLLSNVDNPEEEEIESLCKLLTTVGQALDTPKARGHMDVYFSRMKELAKSSNVSLRMQFMLRDVIELRERKWQSRTQVTAPQTIQQLHDAASKERMQQEREALNRSSMSRGGSRRGHDREAQQVGPDGWAVASGTARPGNKAGDLSHFGKISKAATGPMQFGPTSVFSNKKDGGKRESSQLSRPTSSQNMFSMLEGNVETPVPPPSRGSRPPSRTASVDLGTPAESGQRPRLNLLPRTKPVAEKGEGATAGDEEAEEGEITESGGAKKSSMSKEQAERKIDNDVKEFFAIRNLDEAEDYFTALPAEFHALLVEKLVMRAIESKQTDAQLVGDCLKRAEEKKQCSPESMEQGFLPTAELLDDIAIDAPKAFDLMAIMVKGANLDKEAHSRIAQKVSESSEKLLKLLA